MLTLIILSIFLNQTVVVGQTEQVTINGVTGVRPVVTPGHVNWWNMSARPGEGENIVLYGHSTDVFKDLDQVKIADSVRLDFQGTAYVYTVTYIFTTDRTDGRWILPAKKERVTLVTCSDHGNLIVIAE